MSWKTISSSAGHRTSFREGSGLELCSGILITKFDHRGDGEFKADFIKSGILSRHQVRLWRVVVGTAFAVIAGYSLGIALGYVTSVQYVIQIATGLSTALLTLAGQSLLARLTEPSAWSPAAGAGTFTDWAVIQVIEGDERAIGHGKYRLEVRSAGE